MAKKKTSQKVESRSVRSNMNALIGLCSCIAVVLAIVIFVVNLILHAVGLDGGWPMRILNLVKDIALGVGICLSAYYYARGKKKWIRITVFICIILYVILAILGCVLIS